MDYGGPPPASAAVVRQQAVKARAMTASAPRPQRSLGARVEGSDRQLAAALLFEAIVQSAESHLRVAEEYRRLGILDVAYARLNLALEKEPRLAAAHEAVARVWRDWGFPAKGLGAAYRATYYDPQSASAANTLGTLLDAVGQFDDARRAYERAFEIDPAAGWALGNLCYLELRLGRLDQARSRCEAAVRIAPALIAAHNNLALTFAAGGDFEQASREFHAAGDPAAAEYNLGIAYLANRNYAAAADHFELAIKARPMFTQAKQRAHAARERAWIGNE